MTGANDNDPTAQDAEPKALGACPICRKTATEKYRPFCSKRCADVDLGRWLGGTYAIPARVVDEDEEEEEQPRRTPRPSDDD
ncbi:MAG: gyrase inhibitor YacG [Hyphomicrobiales bacterium]|nr:gyrase inhibitor YacG [Hyphomicrobiales bacterium]